MLIEWLTTYRAFFETLYFLASIGLFATVIIGLRQLSLVKKDMKNRNKRASVEKSIEYLNMFATDIIPKINELYTSARENKVPVYNGPINKSFEFDENCSIDNELVKQQVKHFAGFNPLLNQIEFFSAALISGLADEELAFNPLSETYCNYVEKNYPFICYIRNSNTDLFSYTVQLYNIWKPRIKKRNLEKSKMKLEADISQIKDQKIRSIGV